MRRELVIYTAFISILVVIAAGLLTFYYLQPVEKSISLKDEISAQEMSVITATTTEFNYSVKPAQKIKVEYVDEVRAELGRIEVANNGVLTYKYWLPVLVGCLELSNPDALANSQRVSVYYEEPDRIRTHYGGEMVEVAPGERKEFIIIGSYKPSYNYAKQGIEKLRDLISGVSIYQSPTNAQNPLREPGPYRPPPSTRVLVLDHYHTSCVTIKNEWEFLKRIEIES
ncbi:hypothetical protein D6817_02195 [Candidatus Pacearchaeota archaeon]|nr:MAG: hypothetical protein D6817_02195 [Candidatus Pacearchaeota archaeon]